MEPGYISHMDHVGKMLLGHCDGKGFDLAGPEGFDPISGCRQWEASNPIKQATHC